MLRNGRLVHRGVLVGPEVLEGIVGDALPLGLAYHPGQRVHNNYCVLSQRREDVEIASVQTLVSLRSADQDQGHQLLFCWAGIFGWLTVRFVRRARSGFATW